MGTNFNFANKANVVKINSWNISADKTGAILLTMPNIPRPLHQLNPRNLLGQDCWRVLRSDCLKKAKYTCEACGRKLTTRGAQTHELYSYSYITGTAIFQRCVCLCDYCHRSIHSGHTISDYKEGVITKEKLLSIIEHCFKTVSNYNSIHANQKPLRLYHSFLQCLNDPSLHDNIALLLEKYDIGFYREDTKHMAKWQEWELVYGNNSFKPIFKTRGDWANYASTRNFAQPLRLAGAI